MERFNLRKLWQFALFILVLYALQAFVFPRIVIWGVRPLIMPVAVVGIGFYGGGVWGGVYGLISGILCDAAFGSTPLFTFLLPLIGLGSGMLSKYLLIPGFSSFLICSALGLVVISFFQMFTYVVFEKTHFSVVAEVAALQCVYSLLFTVPLYWPAQYLAKHKR